MTSTPDSICAVVLDNVDMFQINDFLIFIYHNNNKSKKYYLKGGYIYLNKVQEYEYVLRLVELKRKI